MGLLETEALVIKSYNLSEADKIVVFLTKNDGLVKGVAKGAKRLKSRFGSSLEPFTFINLAYFQKDDRELVSIRDIEIVKSSFASASNPDLLSKFAYISELITEFAPPHDPNEVLYRMVKICIETATEQDTILIANVVLYFEIWLLRLGGYLPDWNTCANCKRRLFDNEGGNLQYNFQILCQNCDTGKIKDILSGYERNILNISQKTTPEKFLRMTLEDTTAVQSVSKKLKSLITSILGKKLSFNKTQSAAK